MVYIYAIKLEKGKYYIGKTTNPQFRLQSHFDSNGSYWTKKYKPLKVIEIIPNCDDYDEDKITMKYMDRYGINNVRGGSFVSVKLDESTMNTLKKMSNGTNNKCFVCGKDGHFAKDCQYYNSSSKSEENVIWCCQYCDKEFEDKEKCQYHEKYCKKNYLNSGNLCFKCGKYGHFANNCWSNKFSSKSKKCNICGKYGHYEVNCYQL